jgi:hypothetical protein
MALASKLVTSLLRVQPLRPAGSAVRSFFSSASKSEGTKLSALPPQVLTGAQTRTPRPSLQTVPPRRPTPPPLLALPSPVLLALLVMPTLLRKS